MASLKERIMDVLLSRKLVTAEQLEEALAIQRKKGGTLQKILVDKGLVSESDLLGAMSQGLGIAPISLARLKLDPSLKALIPREVAIQYQLLPVSCMGKTLTIAMADPMNVIALDTVKAMTGLSLNALMATAREIRDAIDQYYGTGVEETMRQMVKGKEQALELVSAATKREEPSESSRLLSLTQDAPVVKFTDSILSKGVRARASDILIEPRERSVRVRYRVDGVLQEGQAPPKQLQPGIVSRIKVMSELNIAERRVPQDGHFKFRFEDRAVDFRVSTLPSSFGENICLRVLDKSGVRLDIEKLGFAHRDLEVLKSCALLPHGMILSTGPTGSGKTTTMYTLLKLADAPDKNLVTVEDPVEFELEGINQVSVKPEIGLTFAAALRSILRQDPDIIMIGEIRDGETADMAIKSALTGHLVLSTLHTNSAAGSITRLVNIGIEPFLLNSCVAVVVGQRLIRKACTKCREVYRPTKTVATRLGLLGPEGEPCELVRAVGCQSCFQTGYAGREVIAEALVMNPEIRELILKRAPEREVEQAARRGGMKTLREQGLAKALAQVTTLEEVFRATIGEVLDE